jgi:subtilisin family serine protease
VIQFFDAKDMKAALPGIKRAGATLLSAEKSGLAVVTVPEATAARKKTVQALSALHGVRLISTFVVPASCNNVASKILGTAKALATPTAAQPNRLGLTGAGEIIAVADTGLDTGNPQTVMADFAGRITAIHSWPISPSFNPFITNPGADDGAADLDSGHGTHVTGSVLGGGSSAGPAIRGLSRGANLVFQAVEQRLALTPLGRQQLGSDPFQLAGLPNDITRLFDQAYQAGARIHSDSWGSDDAGDYAASSRQLDQFVWKYQDLCIVVAAGNSGTDANRDGVVDEGSVGSPGTAKNCITVGASQSLRNFPNATWGAFWPGDFPVPPLSTEKVAADKDKMAAFSGRGPTLDGRIKPDVVAPGSYILSTRSTQIAGNGWGAYSNGHYMYDGGTSMATPLVAGALGLLREYLRTKRGVASPSAALLKASLICGAVRLPLPYVTAGALADNHQGFGRVNIDNIVSPAGGAQFGFQDAATGLSTGAVRTVAVTAVASRKLRVVLAYSDYPGRGLKNNLNLVLISPNGTRHVGNATGGQLTFDTRNNVEIVEVATPAAGAWRVQVIASNVPQGPQRYALAWLA